MALKKKAGFCVADEFLYKQTGLCRIKAVSVYQYRNLLKKKKKKEPRAEFWEAEWSFVRIKWNST